MSTNRRVARNAAKKAKPRRVRLPLKKETALRLTKLQAEFEQTLQLANQAVEKARQRVTDTIGIVLSENGIEPEKTTPIEVTSAEPFELVLDIAG